MFVNDREGDYRLKALLPLQCSEGCWNVSLNDSTHFGGKELTGTSLFVYGFANGISNGLPDKKLFKPAVVRTWNALATLTKLQTDNRMPKYQKKNWMMMWQEMVKMQKIR